MNNKKSPSDVNVNENKIRPSMIPTPLRRESHRPELKKHSPCQLPKKKVNDLNDETMPKSNSKSRVLKERKVQDNLNLANRENISKNMLNNKSGVRFGSPYLIESNNSQLLSPYSLDSKINQHRHQNAGVTPHHSKNFVNDSTLSGISFLENNKENSLINDSNHKFFSHNFQLDLTNNGEEFSIKSDHMDIPKQVILDITDESLEDVNPRMIKSRYPIVEVTPKLKSHSVDKKTMKSRQITPFHNARQYLGLSCDSDIKDDLSSVNNPMDHDNRTTVIEQNGAKLMLIPIKDKDQSYYLSKVLVSSASKSRHSIDLNNMESVEDIPFSHSDDSNYDFPTHQPNVQFDQNVMNIDDNGTIQSAVSSVNGSVASGDSKSVSSAYHHFNEFFSGFNQSASHGHHNEVISPVLDDECTSQLSDREYIELNQNQMAAYPNGEVVIHELRNRLNLDPLRLCPDPENKPKKRSSSAPVRERINIQSSPVINSIDRANGNNGYFYDYDYLIEQTPMKLMIPKAFDDSWATPYIIKPGDLIVDKINIKTDVPVKASESGSSIVTHAISIQSTDPSNVKVNNNFIAEFTDEPIRDNNNISTKTIPTNRTPDAFELKKKIKSPDLKTDANDIVLTTDNFKRKPKHRADIASIGVSLCPPPMIRHKTTRNNSIIATPINKQQQDDQEKCPDTTKSSASSQSPHPKANNDFIQFRTPYIHTEPLAKQGDENVPKVDWRHAIIGLNSSASASTLTSCESILKNSGSSANSSNRLSSKSSTKSVRVNEEISISTVHGPSNETTNEGEDGFNENRVSHSHIEQHMIHNIEAAIGFGNDKHDSECTDNETTKTLDNSFECSELPTGVTTPPQSLAIQERDQGYEEDADDELALEEVLEAAALISSGSKSSRSSSSHTTPMATQKLSSKLAVSSGTRSATSFIGSAKRVPRSEIIDDDNEDNEDDIHVSNELTYDDGDDMDGNASIVSGTTISVDTSRVNNIVFDVTASGRKVPLKDTTVEIIRSPRLVIASKRKNLNDTIDVKEITLTTKAGVSTTVNLTFTNHRQSLLIMRPRAIQMRYDNYNITGSQASVDEGYINNIKGDISHGLDVRDEENENSSAFSVFPMKLEVQNGEEKTISVTFDPPKHLPGIYTGVLKIRTGRKSFVMLLRGEASDNSGSSFHQSRSLDDRNAAEILMNMKTNQSINASNILSDVEHVNQSYEEETLMEREKTTLVDALQMRQKWLKNWIERSNSKESSGSQWNNSNSFHEQKDISVLPKSLIFNYHPTEKTSSRLSSSHCQYDHGVLLLRNFSANDQRIHIKTSIPQLHVVGGTNFTLKGYCDYSVEIVFDHHNTTIKNDSEKTIAHIGYVLITTDDQFEEAIEVRRFMNHHPIMTHHSIDAHDDKSFMHDIVDSMEKNKSMMSMYTLPTNPNNSFSSFLRQSHPMTVTPTTHTPHDHIASIPKELGKKSGIYFKQSYIDFGSTSSGSLNRMKIELCNATNEEVTVFVTDPQLPFVVLHNEVKMRPKCFVRLPIRFVPIGQSKEYSTDLIVQSADGRFKSSILLYGKSQ